MLQVVVQLFLWPLTTVRMIGNRHWIGSVPGSGVRLTTDGKIFASNDGSSSAIDIHWGNRAAKAKRASSISLYLDFSSSSFQWQADNNGRSRSFLFHTAGLIPPLYVVASCGPNERGLSINAPLPLAIHAAPIAATTTAATGESKQPVCNALISQLFHDLLPFDMDR
jgi:hypothetical protein